VVRRRQREGAPMYYLSCGFGNPEGLKFCNECGAPLRRLCAKCGFTNQPQAMFCGERGTFLSAHPPEFRQYTLAHLAEKILTPRSALKGERKQLTVLFADLKGSLELLADRNPGEARQLRDPY
jgi:predicted amidophosphoribosyltransferase